MPKLAAERLTLDAKCGFTLVEFLIVLGILALVVGSSLLFLTSVFKGSNQANVTTEAKQNGQVVLDLLEKQIRNAIFAQSPSAGYIKLTGSSEDPLHIKCFPSTASTNGWIGMVASGADSPFDSSFVPLTNKDDTISGVDIQNCDFRVIEATPSLPAIVSISFGVNQGIAAPSRQDFLANVAFQTTISLRKY